MRLFTRRKRKPQISNIYEIFKDAHNLVKQEKHKEVRQKYNTILGVYNELPVSEKKRIYFHLKKLYEKINT